MTYILTEGHVIPAPRACGGPLFLHSSRLSSTPSLCGITSCVYACSASHIKMEIQDEKNKERNRDNNNNNKKEGDSSVSGPRSSFKVPDQTWGLLHYVVCTYQPREVGSYCTSRPPKHTQRKVLRKVLRREVQDSSLHTWPLVQCIYSCEVRQGAINVVANIPTL